MPGTGSRRRYVRGDPKLSVRLERRTSISTVVWRGVRGRGGVGVTTTGRASRFMVSGLETVRSHGNGVAPKGSTSVAIHGIRHGGWLRGCRKPSRAIDRCFPSNRQARC